MGLPLSSSPALKKKKLTMPADTTPTVPSRSPSPERSMNKNVKVRTRQKTAGRELESCLFLGKKIYLGNREIAIALFDTVTLHLCPNAVTRTKLIVFFMQRRIEMGNMDRLPSASSQHVQLFSWKFNCRHRRKP